MRRTPTRLLTLATAALLTIGLATPALGDVDTDATPIATPAATPEATKEATPDATQAATPDATQAPTPAASPEPQVTDDGAAEAPHGPEDQGPTEPLTIEPWDDGTTVSTPVVNPMARATAAVTPPTWKLPFESGQKWSSGGPHADSDGTARGAVDFAPGSSSNKRVVAIGSGRVYRVTCPNGWFLGVDHGGGWKSEYYHLTGAQSSLVGKWVSAGTFLGTAGSTLPCGGSSNGAHVHLSILYGTAVTPGPGVKRPYYAVNGMRFGNYTVHAGSSAYNGTWKNLSGTTVITNWGCCLTSNTAKPTAYTSAPTPTISGTAAVGSTLTAKPGTWSPAPTLVYQWKRDGSTIAGATSATYTVVKADRGAKITVSVEARRTGSITTTKTSAAVTIPTPVSRLAGPNRYDTSAAISAASFSPGVSVAYLATGTNFPDALSAAAAAGAQEGPVLLVTQSTIPSVIAAELTRLKPQRIVIVGSNLAVSDAVASRARSYSSVVERAGGANRYSTSAAVSARAFSPGVSTVYLATGATFPDALSAAAPAGAAGVPVLLALRDSLPAEIAKELARLRPASITVVGSTGAISDQVAQAAARAAGGVGITRLGGADRYGTSAAIASALVSSPTQVVYVASGANFPDALSGSAVAARAGAPMILTAPASLPTASANVISSLQPARAVVLGGPPAVAETVARRVAALAR